MIDINVCGIIVVIFLGLEYLCNNKLGWIIFLVDFIFSYIGYIIILNLFEFIWFIKFEMISISL